MDDNIILPHWIFVGTEHKNTLSVWHIIKIYNMSKNMLKFCLYIYIIWGFPGGASGKELTCQFRKHKRHRFDP